MVYLLHKQTWEKTIGGLIVSLFDRKACPFDVIFT